MADLKRIFTRTLAGTLVVMLALPVLAGESPGPATEKAESANPADREWDELSKALPIFTSKEQYDAYLKSTKSQMKQLEDTHARRTMALAEAFWNKYPEDGRRMQALNVFLSADPLFIERFPPESDGIEDWQAFMRSLPVDTGAQSAWERKGWMMVQAVVKSPTASLQDKEAAEYALFERDFRQARGYFMNLLDADKRAEAFWAPFRMRFDAHAIRYAELPIMGERARDYLAALKPRAPDMARAGWEHLLKTPGVTDLNGVNADKPAIKALRAAAERQLHALKMEAGEVPVDMQFTAIDGRPVDLKGLRGKVVVVDFWATWCGPCVAELPNLKSVYEKYHARGLEVVGISFDEEQSREKFLKFVADKQLAWPQRFEGAGFGNDDYGRLYGIGGIPTVFLIDKNGKIVDRKARGKRLEPLVRQHLGLEPAEG